MRFSDILSPNRVILDLQSTDKESVLRELVERGFFGEGADSGLLGEDIDRIVKPLHDRERLVSTGLKEGLAVPHAKIEGLDRLTACLGLHADGVRFDASDGQHTHIFIVLLSPLGQNNGAHLKALARVSRLFADGRLGRRLLTCEAKEQVYEEVLTEDARFS